MATTITNTENNTISMYWNTLRSMSKNIRLALAVKLTNSVLEEEREEMSDAAYNKEMRDRFFGKWEGNEMADELMSIIKENSTSSSNRECEAPWSY